MNPVKFPESNVVYGQFQKEYKPLTAMRVDGPAGDVITCWNLSLFERLKVLFSGEVWVSQLTFHAPIQPQMLTAEKSALFIRKALEAFLTAENTSVPGCVFVYKKATWLFTTGTRWNTNLKSLDSTFG